MSTSKDGGLAFPLDTRKLESDGLTTGTVYHGMSLRDWFAGMALQGFLAMCSDPNANAPKREIAAATAYRYADAMLKEREK